MICPLSISILNARPNSEFVKPFAPRAFVLRSVFASPRYLSHKRPNHSNLRSLNPTSPSLALPASTLLVSSSHPIPPVFRRLRTHTLLPFPFQSLLAASYFAWPRLEIESPLHRKYAPLLPLFAFTTRGGIIARGKGTKGFQRGYTYPTDDSRPSFLPWHFVVRHVQTNKSYLHSLFNCIVRPLCAICQLCLFVLEGALKRTR